MKSFQDGLRYFFPTAFWGGSLARREIALTFDDGPNAVETPILLDLLGQYGVKATFFQIGARAAANPHLSRLVVEAGHQIGLHGYEHQSFLLKNESTLLAELAKAQQVLADATGQDPATFNAVRPPFGHFSPTILKTLLGAGYLPVMWSLVPFHWLQTADMTISQVQSGVHNGTILVMHEGLPGPAVTKLMITLLPYLVNEGYDFLTINELWQQDVTENM